MKAVFIREFGGPEVLEIRDVREPAKPDGRQVLVKVTAAGVNRADLIQRKGAYPPPPGYSPFIPGLEFAGVAEEIGDECSTVKPGMRVCGITAGEAQAEYLLIDERLLIETPERLSDIEAAAMPETFITAHDAVFSQAAIVDGEHLLIHAVGSGVGLSALQMAAAKGITVIGTSRTADKLERCREYGMAVGITADDLNAMAKTVIENGGADVVLDLVGGPYIKHDLICMNKSGRLMIVGLTAGSSADVDLGLVLRKRLKLIGTNLRSRTVEEKAAATNAFCEEFLPLIGAGKITPVVDRIFDVDDVAAAHRYLESNTSFGKTVLKF